MDFRGLPIRFNQNRMRLPSSRSSLRRASDSACTGHSLKAPVTCTLRKEEFKIPTGAALSTETVEMEFTAI